MKTLFVILSLSVSGCLIFLDEDCDTYSRDYSHTEYDCYYRAERVEVCNRYYCWDETRDVQVCDEYHVCYDRSDRNWR